MKFTWVIISILFFFSLDSFAVTKNNNTEKIENRRKLIDSLYLSKEIPQLSENDASKIISSYDSLEGIGRLEINDLKTLSVSHASLNEPIKATRYIEKYIKESHDFDFLENDYLKNIKATPEFKLVEEKYRTKFSFLFMVYFYVALVGIFMSIILNLRRGSDRIANILISSFILLSSLFVIHICLYISNVQYLYPHTLFFTITFNFLYGPLLYFYFKRITEKYTFKTRDLLHLIPFFIFLLYFSKYYVLPSEDKLHILLNPEDTYDYVITILVIMKVVSLVVYALLIYRIYIKASNKNLGIEKYIIKWLRNLVVLNIVYVSSHILYLSMVTELLPKDILIHPQIISMVLLVLYVGYAAYIQPQIFNRKFIFSEATIKYQKSGLTEDYSIELKDQLLKLFYEDKIYKENNINLDYLSECLGTNRHSASQVINEHFNMNFFNLINKFRIEEAQEIFKLDFNNNLNIIDVAYDVGFNNKVTFNKAFKEYTGLTPSAYIKKQKKQKVLTAT
jgi:AraC-like DNA-binding protein